MVPVRPPSSIVRKSTLTAATLVVALIVFHAPSALAEPSVALNGSLLSVPVEATDSVGLEPLIQSTKNPLRALLNWIKLILMLPILLFQGLLWVVRLAVAPMLIVLACGALLGWLFVRSFLVPLSEARKQLLVSTVTELMQSDSGTRPSLNSSLYNRLRELGVAETVAAASAAAIPSADNLVRTPDVAEVKAAFAPKSL